MTRLGESLPSLRPVAVVIAGSCLGSCELNFQLQTLRFPPEETLFFLFCALGLQPLCVGTPHISHVAVTQRTALGSWFSCTTIWDLGVEFGSAGPTHHAILSYIFFLHFFLWLFHLVTIIFFVIFETQSCKPGHPGTCYVDQAVLELRETTEICLPLLCWD